MGLLGLFGKGPLSDAKVEKMAKLAANPFAQPDVRMREMQRLINEGTPASLRGVLKRFAANASGQIADEDEKQWLEDALVDVGDDAREPLQSFIRSEAKLTYALRAYERICGAQEAVRFYLEVLTVYGPDDHRSLESKLQLIHALTDHLEDDRVREGVVPFLLDHGDEVRWAAMDVLETAADRELLSEGLLSRALGCFTELVSSPDVGPRVQRRAAEILEKRGWSVGGEFEELAPLLRDEYFLDKKRFVRKRQKKSS